MFFSHYITQVFVFGYDQKKDIILDDVSVLFATVIITGGIICPAFFHASFVSFQSKPKR